MVGGLGEGEWLIEDKMETGQGKELQKETIRQTDRRNGHIYAGVGHWTLECDSLKDLCSN